MLFGENDTAAILTYPISIKIKEEEKIKKLHTFYTIVPVRLKKIYFSLRRILYEDANNIFLRAQYYEYLPDVNNAQADMDSYYALLRGRDVQASGFRFGVPENLGPIVNTPTYEVHPLPAHDGLSLLFGRRNLEGGFDYWWATRQAESEPWKKFDSTSGGEKRLGGAILKY